MKVIRSNLKEILDERNLSIRQVSRDIDYRFDSVRHMYNDENKTYSRELLTRLCNYLDIDIGQLLVFKEDTPGD